MTTLNNQSNESNESNIDESLVLKDSEAREIENTFSYDEREKIRELLKIFEDNDQKDFNEEHNHDGNNSNQISSSDINWANIINLLGTEAKVSGLGGGFNFADYFKIFSDYISLNGLKIKAYNADLADDATISLPDATSGIGLITASGEEGALFIWTTAGVVVLVANSTNVANTDSDTDLSIFDGGTSVSIKNRLGATKTIKYLILYS